MHYGRGNESVNRAVNRRNQKKLIVMMVLVILACALYMLVNVKFGNEKLFWYAMKIRTPKLIVMLITAFAIGGASLCSSLLSTILL